MAGRWMGRRCAGDVCAAVHVAAAAAAVAGAGRCRAAAIRWADKHFWRRCGGSGGGGGDGDRLLAADDRLGAAGLVGNVAVDVGVAVVVDADFVEIIAGTVDVMATITFTMDVAVIIVVVVVVVYVIVIVIDRNSHTILIIDLVSGRYH